jgi:hypothetical protein
MPIRVYPVPLLAGRRPVISDGFDSPRSTANGLHNGVDIDYRAIPSDPPYTGSYTANRTPNYYMPDDVPFLAVDDGVVTEAQFRDFGGSVLVKHADGTSFYAHGKKILVKKGDPVVAGQPLGIIGGGESKFEHLHFSWLSDNTFAGQVDPAPLLVGAAILPMPELGGGLGGGLARVLPYLAAAAVGAALGGVIVLAARGAGRRPAREVAGLTDVLSCARPLALSGVAPSRACPSPEQRKR